MKVAIVGGSLFSHIDGLEHVNEEYIKTPFGKPSSPLIIGKMGAMDVVYLNRHGVEHSLEPHQINYRANMFALKLLDVSHVIAIAAVGGITEKMSPLTCAVPDQIIDYSYGRMQTFNDGYEDEVTHIDFSYPYNDSIREHLIAASSANSITCETTATYGVTQGPRLETIAEIKRMKRDGCDIVGMTGMPEAALARELQMDYANLSLIVNWAAGAAPTPIEAEKHEVISMDEIRETIAEGNLLVKKIVDTTIASFDD